MVSYLFLYFVVTILHGAEVNFSVGKDIAGYSNKISFTLPTSDHVTVAIILFGENDGLIPNIYLHGGTTESIAKIGQEAIPDNKLVMIPECGHMAQFEKADVVNKEIIDFMK